MTAVTQKDIARQLGVSISLVSRVLSGKAADIGVAARTVESICETAERLGYVPQAAARALRGASTQTLGVLVHNFRDPFFGPLIEALQTLAHDADYSLVLFGGGDVEAERRVLLKHGMSGVLLLGGTQDRDRLAPFLAHRIPLVRIGSGDNPGGLCRVQVDERAAFRSLLEHLRGQGAKRLAFLGGRGTVHQHRLRIVRELCELTALRPPETSDSPGGYAAVGTWDPSTADALICSNDALAIGALRALRERGVRVPEDLRVSGFDDIPEAAFLVPGLTTLRQPITAMAEQAFELLRAGLDATVPVPVDGQRLVSPELIIRESA